MRQFEFTLILNEGTELNEETAEALFEAGCDDGSPGMSEGIVTIDFCRAANSLEEAIRSTIEQVRNAGFRVDRAEIDAGIAVAN